MPKKAVFIFFALAFLGAALFIFFTFPRSKDEMPKSNNQQRFVPNPGPNTPNVPNSAPVPETVPHPEAPKVPPGPTLHVMAWASAADAQRLSDDADAFTAATGRRVALTIESDPASYRRDLVQAFLLGPPPDLCLISSRDFSGLDPAQDLADATALDATPPRAVAAFTVDGKVKAVPAEFSVEVLFYNPALFDQAGIGYPGSHWTWDILEADARALTSLKLKDAKGQPISALEMPANFDMWNILCAAAGSPVLDLDAWHLASNGTKASQMRALDLLHELFQEYAITPPLGKNPAPPGALFSKERAALLIAPSDFAATLPRAFHFGVSVLPRDIAPGTLANVNGWAIAAKSTESSAALALARYLAYRPVHAGWTAITPPPASADEDSPAVVCHQSLTQAVVPRVDGSTTQMTQYLDQQLSLLAHDPAQTPEVLYAKIQAQLKEPSAPPAVRGEPAAPSGTMPAPKVEAASGVRSF